MYNLYLFPNNNVSKYREEREDSWKGRSSIDDKKRHMVDLESIREVPHPGPTFVCVGDDDNLVASVDKFRGQLVHMAFDSSWLGEEVVADHCNIVRHCGRCAVRIYFREVECYNARIMSGEYFNLRGNSKSKKLLI